MKKWILILSSFLWAHNLIAQEIKIIDHSTAIYNKKALVILNGFGDSKKNRKLVKEGAQSETIVERTIVLFF